MVATHWNAELNMGSNLWNQAINDKHEANEKKKKIRNNRQQQVTIHLVYGAVVFDAFSVYLFGEEMHVGCVSKWKLLIEGFSKLNRRWKYTNGTHPSECRSRKNDVRSSHTIRCNTGLFICFQMSARSEWRGDRCSEIIRAKEVPLFRITQGTANWLWIHSEFFSISVPTKFIVFKCRHEDAVSSPVVLPGTSPKIIIIETSRRPCMSKRNEATK